jgi:hypothetical protein
MTLRIIIFIIAALGVFVFFLGLRRLWGRRVIVGCLEGLSGLLLLAISALIMAISINLNTYDRLTYEAFVVDVKFRERAPQHFWTYITLPHTRAMVFDLRGDEWQLDARILKWQGIAFLLGLDTGYRLDRLSGRYRDIAQERTAPRTVYSLGEDPGLDVWAIVQKYERWLPWIDTVYGSGTYVPMVDGAQYRVTISATGLLTRPTNDIAREAVHKWR